MANQEIKNAVKEAKLKLKTAKDALKMSNQAVATLNKQEAKEIKDINVKTKAKKTEADKVAAKSLKATKVEFAAKMKVAQKSVKNWAKEVDIAQKALDKLNAPNQPNTTEASIKTLTE